MTEHEPNPEEDAQIARDAIATREFAHALSHLGVAIVSNPTRTEWLALLDVVAESVPDPLSLLPVDAGERMYASHACLRAYLLGRQGQYAEALRYLVAVAEACPDRPFLDWGVGWLTEPGVAETVGSSAAVAFLTACYEGYVNADREVPPLERVLPISERFRASHPDESDVLMLAASLLRRSGRLEEALPVAQEAFEARPSWVTATAVALALREQGQIDEALEWYERGLEFEPDDLTARLDMADMLLERWDLGRAIRLYEEVLRRQPEHPWAAPSAAAARVLLTGREKWRASLQAMTSRDTAGKRARELAEVLARVPEPYVEELPQPLEAMAKVLGQALEKVKTGDVLKVKLSNPEAPSCIQAVRQELARHGAAVEIIVKNIPTPDPRQPAAGATALLWRHDGTEAFPIPSPPDRDVTRAIVGLAATPFMLDEWSLLASRIAGSLPDHAIASLLGVMVHRPPAPGQMEALDWVRKIQVAAGLVLAHFDSGQGRSGRRRGWETLVELARGPIDWVTEVAILGLAAVARRDPGSEERVRQTYQELLDRIPAEGHCCYWRCLVRHWMKLPSVSNTEQDRLEEWSVERDVSA